MIQLHTGRILIPFAYRVPRTWQDRGKALDAFWYLGWNNSTVLYSDDGGDTWQLSYSELKVHTPSITYGGVEPVVVELQDGHVWMLIRTQLGRFYQSFSKDGSVWSPPRPTLLLSSDSPAGLVRLTDGRIVLLWNKCLRFPYAYGGRHVLHAAISEDNGRTWIGQREIFRDPLRNEPPPPRGDHGTAYPFPRVLPDGKIIITTGQGEGRMSIIVMDPAWLYETQQETDFSADLEEWSTFGCKGVDLKPHPQKQNARVLAIKRIDQAWPARAVWNFPSGVKGRLWLKLSLQKGFGGVQVTLTDHFSVPFDPEDTLHSLCNMMIGPEGELVGNKQMEIGQWYTLQLLWDCRFRSCEVFVDNRRVTSLPLLRESEGPCYLRLGSTAEEKESGGFLVENVKVELERRLGK